jgi:SAM-dependent methyltransferase
MDSKYANLVNHYEQNAREYGTSPQGVAWGQDLGRIEQRYRSFASKISFTQSPVSILDVGCGYGEFIRYINNNTFNYVGIDLTELSIKNAQTLYDNKYTFIHGNFLTHHFDVTFDYVICSGLFYIKFLDSNYDMYEFCQKCIKKMILLCNKATIFNLLSTYNNFQSEKMYYKSPIEALAWCLDNVSRKVDIDHSSLDYEYIITLKK